MFSNATFPSLLSGLLGISGATQASHSSCIDFSPTSLPGVSVAAATYYPANTSVDISNLYMSVNSSTLPAFCRLELLVTTNETAGSFANTELWLPDEWNGRMLTIGNGGFAGGADVLTLGTIAVPQGFAGISTNTGHNSSSGDATWGGPHNDNALVDFGWRAVHQSVIAGKEVVKQYYNQAAKRSYYLGCSNGTTAALKEIQLFPDSFDGIVVGAPATPVTGFISWVSHTLQVTGTTTSPEFIPRALWTDVVAPEVLRQCDGLDGLQDGVLSNPRACNFRPEPLTCRPGQDPTTCLTIAQLGTLHHQYTDYFEANQTFVFAGYLPGGETVYGGLWDNVSRDQGGSIDYYRYMVLNDTTWVNADYNSTLFKISEEVNPGQANADDPDLLAFAAAPYNGKVLHYVGLADPLIPSGNSERYYGQVLAHTRAHSPDLDVNDFYRFFEVPGMAHWCGGPGANVFGSLLQPPSPVLDAEHSVIGAIVRWVEEGVAPETLVATKYNDDNPASGVAFTRPLCKYPLTVRYKGGNKTEASSFECV
ncbi:feruloyl esterase-like protein [Trametes maxima]|nr:feruloyl esterase-like protein [Trametes maxima]